VLAHRVEHAGLGLVLEDHNYGEEVGEPEPSLGSFRSHDGSEKELLRRERATLTRELRPRDADSARFGGVLFFKVPGLWRGSGDLFGAATPARRDHRRRSDSPRAQGASWSNLLTFWVAATVMLAPAPGGDTWIGPENKEQSAVLKLKSVSRSRKWRGRSASGAMRRMKPGCWRGSPACWLP
jgi:hypothetical protein